MSDWSCRELGRPSAFIQWKGTEVCMDCYCPCGKQFHVDAAFTYAVGCRFCGRIFEMSSVIEMRELKPEEVWKGCDPVVPGPEWDDEESD